MVRSLGDAFFMRFKKEELREHPLYDLRVLGRSLGIRNSTALCKEALIEAITKTDGLKIEKDEIQRGRPCKERIEFVIQKQTIKIKNKLKKNMINDLKELQAEIARLNAKINDIIAKLNNSNYQNKQRRKK